MSLLRPPETILSSAVDGLYNGRKSIKKYILGERINYPESNELHDVCEFSIQQPNNDPDNYRIYTPTSSTYGIEVVSSNANDSASVAAADAGVTSVEIEYLDSNWEEQIITVDLDGTTPVEVVASGVRRVNDFHSQTTGEWGVARGNITLRTTSASVIDSPWTGTQTLGIILDGGNKDMTALYTVPEGKKLYAESFNASSGNSDQAVRLRSNTDPANRQLIQANCFLFQSNVYLGSNQNNTINLGYMEFPARADIKISCRPTATGADTSASLYFKLIDDPV